MRKNVAGQSVDFQMISKTDGSDVTTGTPVVSYKLDGGTYTTGTGTISHDGNGCWEYLPTQAETNADKASYQMVLTGAVTQTINVWPVAFDPTSSIDLGLTNLDAAISSRNSVTPLDAAGIRASIGLAIANLDTQLTAAVTATGFSTHSVADVFNEVLSKASYNIGQSAGKLLRQSGDLVQIDGVVSDATPSTTNFDTNLPQGNTYFDEALLVFANGSANAGIGRPVNVYTNLNGNMSFDATHPWPVTPVNGDDFVIYAIHIHAISAIQSGLATETKQDIIDNNIDSILADTGTDGVVLSATQMNQIADHLLRRGLAAARASSDGDVVAFRSILGGLSKLTNKVAVVGTDLITYEENDSTSFGTQALTTDANAEPITAMDTT